MLMHGDCLECVFSSLCAAKAARFARMAELVDAADSKIRFGRKREFESLSGHHY
jgi:hypothetical protein